MSELAEGARLEIVCAATSGTEGSNPSLSAIFIPELNGLTFKVPGCRSLACTSERDFACVAGARL